MKDAARLLAYLAATLLFGACSAPALYWTVQWLNAQGLLLFLREYDFETFFHRALLLGALLFFWPLLRSLHIRSWRELGLSKNPRAARDGGFGFAAATLPLLGLGALLLYLRVYSLRSSFPFGEIATRTVSAVAVPFIEEPFFRGLILGILLRSGTPIFASFLTSAIFSILHFLKAPENTSVVVTWASGFVSISNSFNQFRDPVLVAAGFTTLFLVGWILADARIRTRSLWLPIGLHSGWIFATAFFSKIARREMVVLPWLGKNLLIGIVPLCIALITWIIVRAWLSHVEKRQSS